VNEQTTTYAILELSPAAFQEIKTKLETAGYSQAFFHTATRLLINMQGIAVASEMDKKVDDYIPIVTASGR